MEVCRLCLDLQSENTSIQLDGTYKDMVQVVAPELNLEISNTPAVCNKCSKNLEELYVFKTKCFENEENWRDQKSDIGAGTKTDSGNLIESKKAKDIVCRTCMDPIECGSFTVLKPSKSDAYLESMLTMCLPEVDLESTKDPLLCERCTDNLLKLHQFKSACLDIEDLLVNFCETYGTNSSDQINLHSVLESESKINADLGLRNIKCEQFDDESGDTSIKSVSDSEMTGNTSLKQEEVDIKSEEETSTGDNEKTSEESVKYPKCSACTLNKITQHVKKITNDNLLSCTQCSYKTNSSEEFSDHVKAKHAYLKPLACSKCPYETLSSENYMTHVDGHDKKIGRDTYKKKYRIHERSYDCSECYLKKLIEYIRRKNTDEKEISCTQCPYKTENDHEFSEHVKDVHGNLKPHVCPVCFLQTFKSNEFIVHSKTHLLKECKKKEKVVDKEDVKDPNKKLRGRRKNSKGQSKKYACSECPFRTTLKRALDIHLWDEHQIEIEDKYPKRKYQRTNKIVLPAMMEPEPSDSTITPQDHNDNGNT